MISRYHVVLLKSIPYILSIAGGAALFLMTKDEINDPSLADLVTNMAASLLSIPLVFLLYDYSNYIINRHLRRERKMARVATTGAKRNAPRRKK